MKTKQEGLNESTELRYGEVDITETIQCGDYSEPEFKLLNMICASPAPSIIKLWPFHKI
jgi:hypothetical protein